MLHWGLRQLSRLSKQDSKGGMAEREMEAREEVYHPWRRTDLQVLTSGTWVRKMTMLGRAGKLRLRHE